jgi:hypothetical protein
MLAQQFQTTRQANPVQDPTRRVMAECAQAGADNPQQRDRRQDHAATGSKLHEPDRYDAEVQERIAGRRKARRRCHRRRVAGLYQLYLLRKQGLEVKAFDAAPDVGGTWYWNRYPGARFDSESYTYQYLFSEELYKGWSWSEKFPGQPEVERWMHYVADKLDLRRDIQFSTTITSAHFNEASERWTITTDKGEVIDAQFLVTCCGMLSAPLSSLFPGQEIFKGRLSTPRAGRMNRSTCPASLWALSVLARRGSRWSRRSPNRSAT